jgi:uncharacterized protein (DUF697 family)
MTRKPLPKVITRPSAEVRGIASGDGNAAPARNSAVPFDKVEAEPPLAVSSAPIANDVAAPAATLDKAQAAKRRALAHKIVDRHRNYAAVGGLLPVPVVSIAGLTGINVRMVRQLSALYGVPFERDRTRSLIVGIIGGAVPAGLGSATSTALMWVIPGGMLVGLGVSAVSAAALTRGIGLVFIESFEGGAAEDEVTGNE